MVTPMDRNDACDKFLDFLEFDPYPFQEEALLAWFESDTGVLVTAPTGMGKTLVAEAAIFEALATGKRLYYTTPLIALSDQKFREFQDKAEAWGFSRDDVGLVTGNRKVNPDAPIRVVVAEILLNHLLADEFMEEVSGVVMDEFHYFNDFERGIVWELSLVLMPKSVRLMLLSATVGNAPEFLHWMSTSHGRTMRLVQTNERRVPLEFVWVPDKLLTEHLPGMVSDVDDDNRSPALVFCFNRMECWEVAERLKGAKLIDQDARKQIEERIADVDMTQGIAPKLRQMLIRGVGVHHAGVLPKHKEVIEDLFLRKLTPFVVCTETLAAGINLPARSVVISSLIKGKRGDKKLIPASSAHQMFGRAGRPQFDTNGYVYALAHEDDVKIDKWRKKFDLIDPNSKDPGIMRARKQLERKKPSRRKTEQYWTEGQFGTLIKAGPANLYSRSMIPYQVLIYLLIKTGTLHETRAFLTKRFNTTEWIEKFQSQLDHMIGNLASFGYLTRAEDGDHVTLDQSVHKLTAFRSVDPLYGAFMADLLLRSDLGEKIQALESVLSVAPAIERKVRIWDLQPGPLQTDVLVPRLIEMGLVISDGETGQVRIVKEEEYVDYMPDEDKRPPPPPSLPELLKLLFDAKLETPESLHVQAKWLAGGVFDGERDFFKFVKSRDLVKDEGIVLRHLLRLVILAGEFETFTDGDPDYPQIVQMATEICQQVDQRYTERFLAADAEAKTLSQVP